MSRLIKKYKTLASLFGITIVFITSITLGFHNATLYNPSHGFDGSDHLDYIRYINKHWQIPQPKSNPEAHQSPLYYFIGALLMRVSGTWKTAQYLNIFVLWMIIGIIGIGLWKIFQKKDQVLIGMFALAALPMLNIFPAMITNELLNTFWIVSGVVACLFLLKAKTKKETILIIAWLSSSLIFGYWTKVSIMFIYPIVFLTFLVKFFTQKDNRRFLIILVLATGLIVVLFSSPIYFRAKNAGSGSDIIGYTLTKTKYAPKPLAYYFRLDWILKADMYNTQYYSLIGAAWNSFWTDGHNAITPFIKFHKKSFVLWSLGFFLFPLCLYGLVKRHGLDKKSSLIVNSVGLLMLAIYVFANFTAYGHYSSARLTYEMGVVVAYAFGIAGASENRKLKIPILTLLSVQFMTMVSFFWIQGWWHVVR